jgi:hypothetical protein
VDFGIPHGLAWKRQETHDDHVKLLFNNEKSSLLRMAQALQRVRHCKF